MPPLTLRLCPQCHHLLPHPPSQPRRSLATASSAIAITPAVPPHQLTSSPPPIARYPSTQPPSHRPPSYRKSQLHRHYTSLLRSTPLLLLFQHNNLAANEWSSLRRELGFALQKIDAELSTSLAPYIKLQTVQTGIFESALLIADYYDPHQKQQLQQEQEQSATKNQKGKEQEKPTHSLSTTAHAYTKPYKPLLPLSPLLTGPLALLTFPLTTPPHLRAALSILSPKAPLFPPPTRRSRPGYHEASVQSAVQKLLLLGARVDGRVLDLEGVRWMGGLEGGVERLRGELVGLLRGAGGGGLVGALEGVGRGVWVALEGRRGMLEEEEKGKEGGGG